VPVHVFEPRLSEHKAESGDGVVTSPHRLLGGRQLLASLVEPSGDQEIVEQRGVMARSLRRRDAR
jgi:hypothetical protein